MNRQNTQQRVISKANGVSEPLLNKAAHRDAFVLDRRLMTASPKTSPILSRDGKVIHQRELNQGSMPIPRSSSLGQATLSTYKLADSSKPQLSQQGQTMTASTRKNQHHAHTLGQSRGRQLLSLSPKLSLRHSFKSSTSSISSNSSSAQSLGSMTSVNSADDARSLKFRQTHVAAYKFIARHEDEISFDLGDAIQVEKKYDDLWFEGMNLRTGGYGIFPSRYVSDVLSSRSPMASPTPSRRKDVGNLDVAEVDSQQFLLRFLGSIEVNDFKGNEVICEAMREIAKKHQLTSSSSKPVHSSIEVSVQGVKVVDFGAELLQSKKQNKLKLGKLFEKEQKDFPEHFFALKNVTFCGCHPQNPRYFAFITKHPDDRRFACHVFMSENSTEPVARAIGEVFKEFYAKFLDQTAMAEEFPDVEI